MSGSDEASEEALGIGAPPDGPGHTPEGPEDPVDSTVGAEASFEGAESPGAHDPWAVSVTVTVAGWHASHEEPSVPGVGLAGALGAGVGAGAGALGAGALGAGAGTDGLELALDLGVTEEVPAPDLVLAEVDGFSL